ncbi:MAG: FAD binding domain-containing protein [Planctomycetota bacterium]
MRPFEVKSPRTLREAVLELPDKHSPSGARLIAGGQDLLTVLKDDIEQPPTLVRLRGVPDLDLLVVNRDGTLDIGALVTLQDLADNADVQRAVPALSQAAASIASAQIRSQATVGGNLNQRPRCPYFRHPAVTCFKKGGNTCLAEFGFSKYAAILGGGPSYFVHPSDLAPVMLALDATFHLVGKAGARAVKARDYYVLSDVALDTESVRRADEVLVKATIPALPAGLRTTYHKFKERASYDFALVAAAVGVLLEGDRIAEARVVLGGVAPMPWRSLEAEAALVGQVMGAAAWRRAGEAAVRDAAPLEHNGYKVHLVKGVLYRALESIA